MERTQTLIVDTRLTEVNKFANHLHYIGGFQYFINRRPINHR